MMFEPGADVYLCFRHLLRCDWSVNASRADWLLS